MFSVKAKPFSHLGFRDFPWKMLTYIFQEEEKGGKKNPKNKYVIIRGFFLPSSVILCLSLGHSTVVQF